MLKWRRERAEARRKFSADLYVRTNKLYERQVSHILTVKSKLLYGLAERWATKIHTASSRLYY